MKIRLQRNLWKTFLAAAGMCMVCMMVMAVSGPAYGEGASGIYVSDGLQAEELARSTNGDRWNRLTFTPDGELITSVVNSNRNAVSSYIASIGMDGTVGVWAEPRIEAPNTVAFTPLKPGLLFFLETAGYADYLYSVPPGGTSADTKLIAGGFVVVTDMATGPDGNIYVADIYKGIIYKVEPGGVRSVFASGFTKDTSGYPGGNGRWLGLAFDPNGNLLVSDSVAHTIYLVNSLGLKTPLLSDPNFSPGAMVALSDGGLIVASVLGGPVLWLTPDGEVAGYATGFHHVPSMTMGPDGSLYVLDWMTSGWPVTRVIKITREEVPVPTIEAAVDLDPDTLNLKSKGKVVTCYIELPEDANIGDIDLGSVAITAVNGVALDQPIMAGEPMSTGDYDGDGVPDLMVKFDRAALAALLAPGSVEITVSGKLVDGTLIEGSDTIVAIK